MTMQAALEAGAEFVADAEAAVEAAAEEAMAIGAGNLGGAVAAAGIMAIALGTLSLSLNISQQLREATKEGGGTTGR